MISALREAPLPDGTPGPFSMRRIGALVLYMTGTGAGTTAILCKQGWEVVGVAFGVPYLFATLLLLFTTWADIKALVAAYKGGTVE